MNGFDAIAVLVFAGGVALGSWKGPWRQAVVLVGVLLGGLLGARFSRELAGALGGPDPNLKIAVAFTLVLGTCLLGSWALGRMVWARPAGWGGHLAGALVGAVTATVLLALLSAAVVRALPAQHPLLRSSTALPLLMEFRETVQNLASADPRGGASDLAIVRLRSR